METIANDCSIVGTENFVKLFHDNLGIRNESCEVVEYEYCLAKYAVDNKVLELDGVEMNPQHIDSESVDCENIIEVDKRKSEKDLVDKASSTVTGERAISCLVNKYRDSNIYDWNVALKVVNKLDFSRGSRQVQAYRSTKKIAEFALSIFTCIE